MTRHHANRHWQRLEAVDARRGALCNDVMRYDRRPGELWRALRDCPPMLAARYQRLCRIVALYRVAAVLGSNAAPYGASGI